MTDYPEAFTFAHWAPDSRLDLLRVPWDSSYRNIPLWDDEDAQEAYFNKHTGTTITGATLIKYGMPVNLPVPFDQAAEYNYVRVCNPYDGYRKKYYYFITDCEYIADNVTRINISVDAWATWQRDVTFGRSYVERGHVGVANTVRDWGRGTLDLPEGLDLGSDHQIRFQKFYPLLDHTFNSTWSSAVVIVSTVDLTRDPGTVENPHKYTAVGSSADGLPNGADVYYLNDMGMFYDFMHQVSGCPWASEGIQQIYAVPPLPKAGIETHNDHLFHNDRNVPLNKVTVWASQQSTVSFTLKDFRGQIALPERYRHLVKFYTYPYTAVEITPMNGNNILIKPQFIQSYDLVIQQAMQVSPPNPQIVWTVKKYNTGEIHEFHAYRSDMEISGEALDNAVRVTDFPTFSIVNNNGINYLASHAHTLSQARANAQWARAKTQASIDNTYAQAGLAMRQAGEQTALANTNRNQQLAIGQTGLERSTHIGQLSNIGHNVIGIGGSILNGQAGSALASGLNAGVDLLASQAQLSNSLATTSAQTAQANSYNTMSTRINNAYAQKNADMNKSYAQYAMQGDYANAIANINATVQDAQMINPSSSGAMGGDTFNFVHGLLGVMVKIKTLSVAALRAVGEYWLRYGYYVQRFLIPDFHTMQNFEYWKMTDCEIVDARCPETFRQTIRGIFERGTTIWHDPDNINIIDIGDNEPNIKDWYR